MKALIKLVSLVMIFLAALIQEVNSQDLESLLDEATEETVDYTRATFKSTRIMNGHSIERMPEGQLDFRISHRFGRINSGAYEFFGLDQANIHLSLEYGIKDWIMVGIGRGTYDKTLDGFAKFSIIRQSTGKINRPVSLSWFSGIYANGLRWSDPERNNYFVHRLSYVHQLLVARKFNERFSLQLTPSYLHQNLVQSELDPNDFFALGAGTRFKLTKRTSFNIEYYHVFKPNNMYMSTRIYDPLSIGFDIETGGHVFQIIMTNSLAMRENGFIGNTTGSWLKGDIHLGFNISRVFQLKDTGR